MKDDEDLFGMNEAMDSAIKVHYYLEMPDEIIDSIADFVDGNKAEWHMVNANSIREYMQNVKFLCCLESVYSVASSCSLLLQHL